MTELEARLSNLRAVLPEEKDVADLLRRLQTEAVRSNIEMDVRTWPGGSFRVSPEMADEFCLRRLGRIEQGHGPVGHIGDARQRLAARAAVAGQIRRQHGKTVMCEPAAVQRPGRVIKAGAVDHHHRGQ